MPDYHDRDFVTGFYLKVSFYHFLRTLINESFSKKKIFSLVLIDLDNFKKLNDKFGHLVGDDILVYVAGILRLFFTKEECFRYGGDEFIAALPDKDPEEAFLVVSKIKGHMNRRPFQFKGMPFKITFSCGIAGFPSDGETMEEIIKRADRAMYFSKRHGGGFITLAGKMRRITARNVSLVIASACLISLAIFTLYNLPVGRSIFRSIDDIRHIRITAQPKLDTITLKNGRVLTGKIVRENDRELTLSMPLREGEASLVLKKSEILEIEYAD